MALIDTGVRTIAGRLPKVVSPKTHAIIDYATAGSFIVVGALMMKKHKRAGIASLIAGVAHATTAMLTDYPGGVAKVISFQKHGQIEAGIAAAVEAVPSLLGISDRWPATFFRVRGLGMAVVTGLTDFEEERGERRDRRRYRAA